MQLVRPQGWGMKLIMPTQGIGNDTLLGVTVMIFFLVKAMMF